MCTKYYSSNLLLKRCIISFPFDDNYIILIDTSGRYRYNNNIMLTVVGYVLDVVPTTRITASETYTTQEKYVRKINTNPTAND